MFTAQAEGDRWPQASRTGIRGNARLGGLHLGANLARLELQEIFRRLVPRIQEVELAGPVSRMRSSFVGGIKRMPLKIRLRESGAAR